ncbi:hypothetical protein HDU96_001896 [Phlyctochytrium bullatum]|nr:hypothetical protein HDU96_001896 [Phlyctochytrium bullatum]
MYRLAIVQQPQQARMSGLSLRDRRHVDPPPVLKLTVFTNEQSDPDGSERRALLEDLLQRSGHFVVHATLLVSTPAALVDPAAAHSAADQQLTSGQTASSNDGSDRLDGQGQNTPTTITINAFSNSQPTISIPLVSNAAVDIHPSPSEPSNPPSASASSGNQPNLWRSPPSFPLPPGPPPDSLNPLHPTPHLDTSSTNPPSSSTAAPQRPSGVELHYHTNHQVIMGSLVSCCHILTDIDGEKGAFFIFSDLAVRASGAFRLKFDLFDVSTLVRMTSMPGGTLGGGSDGAPALASAVSDVFHVYSPKTFPGMSDSTPLTKWFAKQGMKLFVRWDGGAAVAKGEDED